MEILKQNKVSDSHERAYLGEFHTYALSVRKNLIPLMSYT
jgi:hypothetical protein